jgi:hypothetical protein
LSKARAPLKSPRPSTDQALSLSQTTNLPPPTFVDAINVVLDSTIPYDLLYFQSLADSTFNVQRHLTAVRTHRAFRASAPQTWREVVATASKWELPYLQFRNVTSPVDLAPV